MSAEAAALRCPSCGASVNCSPDVGHSDSAKAAECGYCHAFLHPTRCPWCFDWTFSEARDCARCGSRAEPQAAAAPPSCPSCREALTTRASGAARLSGCARCGGVWADAPSFRTICGDRETQAAYLGDGSVLPAPRPADPRSSPIVYRPCAVCGEMMNRFNFAACSGVILDVCKPHGIWFDPDELRRIVEFIRGGGLDMARAKELRTLELERRRLEQAAADTDRYAAGFTPPASGAISSARDLLRFLLDQST